MLNRLKKKLHKLKNPQMEFPLNGIGAEPQFEIITFGPENNDLLFFQNEDGSRSQMFCSDGVVINGELYFPHSGDNFCWYPDGKVKGYLRRSMGQMHGKQISWYPDGNFKKIWNWHFGKFHGRWMEWYENGVTSFQGHYRYGKKHGKWWEWYENGKMAVSAEFLDGYTLDLTVWKPDGTLCPESGVSHGFGYWLTYNPDGSLKNRNTISNGEIDYEDHDEL